MGPGVIYSFVLNNPAVLRVGGTPMAVNVEGLASPYSALLYSSSFSAVAPGDYQIIVGLVPAGLWPSGPQDAIPGYVSVQQATVR
jgi:hypothetical protein